MATDRVDQPAARRPLWGAVTEWLGSHDPEYDALRRAVRTAVVVPIVFAFVDKVIANTSMATFAAFGAIAMLLLVDFSGPIQDRALAQAALGLTCAVLIALGTFASRSPWVAAAAMAVVALPILFAGVVSSEFAGATTALLLAFVLPVTLPGDAAAIPDRVMGWSLAAAVSVLAIIVLWPAPERNPLRAGAIDAAEAVARRLRADVTYLTGPATDAARDAHRAVITEADEAVRTLYRQFFASIYRPTGLTTEARAVVRLVDELRWCNAIVRRTAPITPTPNPNSEACAVKLAAADVLQRAAELLRDPHGSTEKLHAADRAMHDHLMALERAATAGLPADVKAASADGNSVITALDPSFRAQELSFIVGQIASNAGLAAAAASRSWVDRMLGRQPGEIGGPVAAAWERARAHFEPHSVWLHNSLRGAAALALAVFIADAANVEHGFWVVFGTLSVLRSNALSTGQNLLNALIGTTAGFVIGGCLVYVIGTDTALLWVLFPIALFFAALAPATVSFAAGQAGFTLTLLILFNLLAPAGWQIGIVRIADIAIGGGVSLVIGMLFWPRGARLALRRSLAEAYADGAHYLAEAVAFGIGRCDGSGPAAPPPSAEALRAAAASRRLDDAFREFLGERGSKPLPLAEVTRLVTGASVLRLAGDAVLDLWTGDNSAGGDRSVVRHELQHTAASLSAWYGNFAKSLVVREDVPDPQDPNPEADARLLAAVIRDLRADDGEATATGVRVIWTGDHLDAVRRLQKMLVPTAREALAPVVDGATFSVGA